MDVIYIYTYIYIYIYICVCVCVCVCCCIYILLHITTPLLVKPTMHQFYLCRGSRSHHKNCWLGYDIKLDPVVRLWFQKIWRVQNASLLSLLPGTLWVLVIATCLGLISLLLRSNWKSFIFNRNIWYRCVQTINYYH